MLNLSGKILYLLYSLLGWRFFSLAGSLCGTVFFFLKKKKRSMAAEEISFLFNDTLSRQKVKQITKKSFRNYYKRQVETFFFGGLTLPLTREIIKAEGLGNLDTALSRGKGVILLLSHFGSFLLPLPYLGFKGYPINQVTGKQHHGSLFSQSLWKWRQREADRLPVNYFQADKFLRPVYKALKNNEIVAIAFDGRDGSAYQEIQLLDRKAIISPGPLTLALKTGAAIVPVFVVRQKDDTQKMFIEKPFDMHCNGFSETTLAKSMNWFAKIFSGYLAAYPCHYGMILQIMRSDSSRGKAKPFFSNGIEN